MKGSASAQFCAREVYPGIRSLRRLVTPPERIVDAKDDGFEAKSPGVGVFIVTVGFVLGLMTAAPSVQADHSFGSQNWDSCGGGNGCIGWKQFAEDGTSLGIAHMDNGGGSCGTSIDVNWAAAITYWNSTGTVVSFTFPVSNCTPQSYPTVRVVPYDNNAGATGYWAVEWTYDQNPSTSAFSACWQSCSLGTGGNAQKGYDLSEVLLNTYYSPSWTWVSKHELGHTVGLDDHSCGYSGLMDSDACTQINATNAELDEVDTIHDH